MTIKRVISKHLVLAVVISMAALAQESASRINEPHEFTADSFNSEEYPCMTDFEYAEIKRQIGENIKQIGSNPIHRMLKTSTVALEWPLMPSDNLKDPGYYFISAFVDLDRTSGILDWNCGSRTYNGHRGVDIAAWPFGWNKMDSALVQVIAAAPGTIVAKSDGNFDRVCNPTGNEMSNYVVVQHADGSQALYVHLKKWSLTSKPIGATVATGEYLGIVGSAGISNGVHLHFEIHTDNNPNNFIDPFYGSCNTGIGSSWWANQNPDTEPEILKLSLHSTWPYFGSCPNTVDSLYEAHSFPAQTNETAVFNVFSKHVSVGMQWKFKILKPDSSTFDSWEYTSLSTRAISNLGWSRTLPTEPGTYSFESIFNDITYTKTFVITGDTSDVLPVELTSFTACAKQDFVELLWSTATETNNYGFEVERYTSVNRSLQENGSLVWSKIGFVEGAGTSHSKKRYSFIERNLPTGAALYRLKQIDRNGNYSYSHSVEVEITSLPDQFFLLQNFPNPFNPSTIIKYQIPTSSLVMLRVYDPAGKEVSILVNETQAAGAYSVNFDAAQLPSGTYFYSLQAGNTISAKKLMLIK